MESEKTGRNQRSVWNAFTIEEGFKQRQILRLLLLTGLNVLVSTIAFVAFYNYEMQAVRTGLTLDTNGPNTLRIAIVWVGLMGGLGGLFALFTGLLMTHRMAGPIHNFKAALAQISAGHPPRPIAVRKGDEFGDMADALNEALETLWLRASSDDAGAGELAHDLDRMRAAHLEILDGLESIDLASLSDADRSRVEDWKRRMTELRDKLDA